MISRPPASEGAHMIAATIRAADVALVLAAHKACRYNGGLTCRMAALSPAPTITLDCHDGSAPSDSRRRAAARFGNGRYRVAPMERGYVHLLYERARLTGGREAVIKTWGIGIRALRAERKYVLQGGSGE